MQADRPILVAGGGPVGVIMALALARQDIPVHVLEAEARVNDSPRAATTHAATLEMLDDLGLVEEVARRGLIEPKFRIWDRAGRKLIVEFDFGVLRNDTRFPYVIQCEQHKLANMTIERLRSHPHARVEFSARVTAVEQFDDRVEVTVDTASGARKLAGSYLIGADGGRSTVRKALDIEFEGYTHPERFLVLTTTFSFDTEYAQCSRNYFSDPDEWCALFKVTGDDGRGLWRVLFPTRAQRDRSSRRCTRSRCRAGCRGSFPSKDLIRWSTATCTTCISVLQHRSARAACFSPAMRRTSTIRLAGSG